MKYVNRRPDQNLSRRRLIEAEQEDDDIEDMMEMENEEDDDMKCKKRNCKHGGRKSCK